MITTRTLLFTRIIRYSTSVVAGAMALAAALAFVPTLLGREVLIVTSRSMEPWAKVGGVVVTRLTQASAVGVGDVITYRMENSPATTHRVVKVVKRSGNTATFITKGDANENRDPQPVHITGKVAVSERSIPFIGRVLAGVRQPFAALAFIALGIAVSILERTLTSLLRRRSALEAAHRPSMGGAGPLSPSAAAA